MTIGAGGGGGGSRSNSRNSRTNKYSTSKLRNNSQHGSNVVTSGTSSLGGQPLNSPGIGAGKGDIKHRFEIIRKLGSGTYGKVSLAYDHKNDREVAVKLIKKSAIENKQDLVRIRREIRIMSALKHPNIIQIFEVFENRDKIILVMEYASGGELYDYVSTYGSLPEAEARRIFRQITSAVLYCHKVVTFHQILMSCSTIHKVAHRDLKLENILLDVDNNAKIADFGLSNYFSEKSLLSTFCGSPLYASPEIINGTPYRGPEVDCWSLGILLYTLVYGSMPFDGRDFNRMVRQIKRGAYFEPDTPSTASMLIRNMLRVNPERRADIDDIASHWWLNLEENMPVIQELPENQIVDFTPLTERAETMVVQDLADETDVFMDFGHLSAATRKKIEEFRRRRKEAEEYNENSPIKPPKSRKTDGHEEQLEMLSAEKSLRHDVVPKRAELHKDELRDDFNDPLERLRRLESRLQSTSKDNNKRSPDRARLTSPVRRDVYRRQPAINNDSNTSNSHPYSRTSEKKPLVLSETKEKIRMSSPEQPDDPTTSGSKISQKATSTQKNVDEMKKPSFVAIDAEENKTTTRQPFRNMPTGKQQMNTWRVETDSLNMLMNQVLEQMESGPVSMNLIARIKAHPLYDARPMVKELLESIIAAQPPSVQKQASKLIQQQSQELVRRQQSEAATQRRSEKNERNVSGPSQRPTEAVAIVASDVSPKKYELPEVPQRTTTTNTLSEKTRQKDAFEERPWHSVEVGFDPDEEESERMDTDARRHSICTNGTEEETVQDTSFEDETDAVKMTMSESDKIIQTSSTKAGSHLSKRDTIEEVEEMDDEEIMTDEEEGQENDDEEEEDGEEEDEEEYNTEIDELGNEVEQIEEDDDNVSYASAVSQQINEYPSDNQPPPDPQSHGSAPKFVDTFDRGLAKRQSKGKYQHNKVELYGRGVSTECESPTFPHRRIGGPQPTIERSPFLFDKAKKYIMTYPKQLDDSEDDLPGRLGGRKSKDVKKNWLRTQDPDVMGSSMENASQSATPSASRLGSLPPRSLPKTTKSEDEEASELEEEEEGDDEDDEETKGSEEDAEEKTEEEEEEEEEEEGEVQIHTRIVDSSKLQQPPSHVSSTSGHISEHNNSTKTTAESRLAVRSDAACGSSEVNNGSRLERKDSNANELERMPLIEKTNNDSERQQEEHQSSISNQPHPISCFFYSNNELTTDYASNTAGGGMQSWETAASYIRRKNRERRQRNRTIATSEDLLRSAIEYRDLLAPATFTAIGGERYSGTTNKNALTTITGRALSPTSMLVGRGSSINTSINNDDNNGHDYSNNRKDSSNNNDNSNSAAADAFYSHVRPIAATSDAREQGSLFPYVRPRYHDESYRRKESETDAAPLSPARFKMATNQAYTFRDDRAKSKSIHDLSPDRPDMNMYPTAIATKYASGASPSYASRYDGEQYRHSNALQNWANEPKKFHVYQTRAEREAERNTAVNNLHPSSTYRPAGGSSWYMNAASGGGPSGGIEHRATNAYHHNPGSTYRSRYDDNFSYRRGAYDVERQGTPGSETQPSAGFQSGAVAATQASSHDNTNAATTTTNTAGSGGIVARFRPVTRRIATSLINSDRYNNNYARSHSMDRKFSHQQEDSGGGGDANVNSSHLRNRLLSPELSSNEKNDYSYVNYHDTASARGSIPKEPDSARLPSRGILKNKQSADLEPRATTTALPTSENGRGLVGGKDQSTTTSSGMKNVLDRLKRHLSTEKSVSPAPASPTALSTMASTQPRESSVAFRHRFGSAAGLGNTSTITPHNTTTNSALTNHASIANNYEDGKVASSKEVTDDQRSKKRTFLSSLGRRRTTEMRLNADGKIVTADLEDDLKRPSSPIEKIKSLFRKNKDHRTSPISSSSNQTTTPISTPSTTVNNYSNPYDFTRHYSPVTSSNATSSNRIISFAVVDDCRYGLMDRGLGVYPSSNLSPVATRESHAPYTPQYRKVTGASAGGGMGINLNRYSYTPGMNSERPLRHWYEDSHLY
ncbi:unnamed protein product [Anisakis simplex]|uniref:Protein kinase domain-containing protein n=1 Tax=Anisakis simplex TaxID=6269 RepID=A0A158PNQ9_ANISI|nr:unnamed protein product [Anisakis simplex]